MTVHRNDPEKFIDDPEYFSTIAGDSYAYIRAKKSRKNPPNLALHNWMEDQNPILTNINMLSYIIPVKCNVKILNCRKSPAKKKVFS